MKKSRIIIIITLAIVLFLAVSATVAEAVIKSTGAYKQSVSFLESDSTIRNEYGEITEIGFLAIGGFDESISDGNRSGTANFSYDFKTKKGKYHISINLTEDNAPWKVTDYKIK